MVIDEIDDGLVRETQLVAERDLGRNRTEERRGAFALAMKLAIPQRRSFIRLEVTIQRVERDDGRQQRRIRGAPAGDEIARGHARVADAAGNRGAHFGEFQIELGGL